MARKSIDEDQLLMLASIGCRLDEMCDMLHVGKDLLMNDYYQSIINEGRGVLKLNLRQKQLKIALDDKHKQQANMLKYLGKVVLKQTELEEFEGLENQDDVPNIVIPLEQGEYQHVLSENIARSNVNEDDEDIELAELTNKIIANHNGDKQTKRRPKKRIEDPNYLNKIVNDENIYVAPMYDPDLYGEDQKEIDPKLDMTEWDEPK